MKILLLNLILFFINNEIPKKEPSALLESPPQQDLLFHSEMGPANLDTEVFIFNKGTQKNGKALLILLKQKGQTVFSDTLSIQMEEEPWIELREINGDNIPDLAIEYIRPGRGGNNVSLVYIYDKEKLTLKRIVNSVFFPNLNYDESLGFTSSFRFYGGDAVQLDFLKINKDSLVSKYRVIREVQNVYLEKYEKDSWIDLGTKTIDRDIIIPEIIQLEPEILIK